MAVTSACPLLSLLSVMSHCSFLSVFLSLLHFARISKLSQVCGSHFDERVRVFLILCVYVWEGTPFFLCTSLSLCSLQVGVLDGHPCLQLVHPARVLLGDLDKHELPVEL